MQRARMHSYILKCPGCLQLMGLDQGGSTVQVYALLKHNTNTLQLTMFSISVLCRTTNWKTLVTEIVYVKAKPIRAGSNTAISRTLEIEIRKA